MLSIRMAVFAAVSAIALWGLFSLLDTLSEPELLRTAKAVVVKGCEPIESAEALQLCPRLFCQKQLIDKQLAPRATRFEITVDRSAGEERLIGGRLLEQGPEAPALFACVIHGTHVSDVKLLDAAALDALSSQPGGWMP